MHELTIRKCDNGYIVNHDNGCSVVQGNLNNLYSFLDGIKFDPVEDERKRAKEKLRPEDTHPMPIDGWRVTCVE